MKKGAGFKRGIGQASARFRKSKRGIPRNPQRYGLPQGETNYDVKFEVMDESVISGNETIKSKIEFDKLLKLKNKEDLDQGFMFGANSPFTHNEFTFPTGYSYCLQNFFADFQIPPFLIASETRDP